MSDKKYCLNDIVLYRLTDKSNISNFNCDKDDDLGLNDFIHNEALNYQKELIGVTYLCYEKKYPTKLLGYVTIAMGAIRVKGTKLRLSFYNDKVRYPALLLGRLGVDNEYRRKNVGKCMCLWCIGLAKKLSEKIGCRFVVLSTQSKSRIDFYKECGFKKCPRKKHKSTENVLMYFQL